MTTINLKDFYYRYIQDQFIEVSEEVAEALRASVRYEAAYPVSYTHLPEILKLQKE